MNDPYEPPSSPPPAKPIPEPGDTGRGSLAVGFGTGCAVLILGPMLAAALSYGVYLVTMGGGNSPDFDRMRGVMPLISALQAVIPLALLVGAAVHFVRKGQPRAAMGVLASLLAAIAVALLLVAACFGIFAASGSNWH
jgi:hypothetical protein